MSENKLDKLEEVALRKIWPQEAQDFSKWLASEEGLNLLSETIKVNFSSADREERIGAFSCDILGVETETNKKIVIENQLEKTDHDHLGKIITYSAGSDASIVIWIFREIQEEHRQAIDWLNDITNEDISFFALGIRLYKIGNSNPAPKFELICKPNIFGKASKRTSDISETQRKQEEFWRKLRDCENKKREGNLRFSQTSKHQNYYTITTGYRDIVINLYINTQQQEARCEFQIPEKEKLFYDYLMANEEDITIQLGKVEWRERGKSCIISQNRSGFNLDNEDKFETYFDWFIEKENLFRETLLPYLEEYKKTNTPPNTPNNSSL